MGNYAKKAVYGASIIFFMNILAAVISYITRIVLARELGPYNYGLFYSVFTFVAFFLFFRDLGLNTALVKHIPEFLVEKEYHKIKTAIFSVLTLQLLSSLLFTIPLFFLAEYLAVNYFGDKAAAKILQILLIYIFGSIFFRLFKSIFQGFQRMKIYSLFDFLKNSSFLLLTFIFLKQGFGYYSPAFAYALLCFLIAIALLPLLLKIFPFFRYKIIGFLEITKKNISFGLPVFATALGGTFISYIDTILLTYFRTLNEVGIYNVILPSSLIFLYFGGAISSAVFPMVSELWSKGDLKRLSSGLEYIYRYTFLIIIPPALVIVVFSDLLIKSFFGIEYLSGAMALQILMFGMLTFVVAGINNNIIAAIGKPKVVAKIIILAAIVNVIFNLILIPSYGIEGAAISTSISYLLTLIISTFALTKYIKIKFPKEDWFKQILVGIFFFFLLSLIKSMAIFINPWTNLFFTTFITLISYVILIYILGLLNLGELRKVIKILTHK
jgi:O-antigen/teichoic acid export membrane protein